MHEDMEDQVPYLVMDLVDVVMRGNQIWLKHLFVDFFHAQGNQTSLLQNSNKGYNILLPPTLFYNLLTMANGLAWKNTRISWNIGVDHLPRIDFQCQSYELVRVIFFLSHYL
jgi:hypothetical protein